MSLNTLYLAGSVAVLAVLAAALMRGLTPASAWALEAARGLVLRHLSRGLGLTRAPRTPQAHAVAAGRFRGRELRLQLGAGSLHVNLRTRRSLDLAPLDFAELCVRARASGRLPAERLEFGASSLALRIPLRLVPSARELHESLPALFEVLEQVEADLESPQRLADAVENRHLSGRMRARVLQYRVAAFAETDGTAELLAIARRESSPEVRIAAARLSGSAGEEPLRNLAKDAQHLSARAQRALVDALLELKPSGLESALSSIADCARAKTLLHLIAAVRGSPESLAVARRVLGKKRADGENGIAARRAAIGLLKEIHPASSWKDDALRLLADPSEPVALRQEAFEALVASKCRRPALDCMRTIAESPSSLRAFAIAALARHRGAREADFLIDLARRDPTARLPLLLAFSDIRGSGEDWLLECLSSESRLVVEHALQHLAAVGGPRALSPLRASRSRLLALRPVDQALVTALDVAIDEISRRLGGAGGVGGGLSMSSAAELDGALMLSPGKGSLSEPEQTT